MSACSQLASTTWRNSTGVSSIGNVQMAPAQRLWELVTPALGRLPWRPLECTERQGTYVSTLSPGLPDWRVPHIDDPVLIPLRDRLQNVIAYAIVDADRADEISSFRWSLDYRGYAIRASQVCGKQYTVRMHKQVVGEVPPGMVIDHINRNKLDNRRSNVRVVTQAENMLNKGPRETSIPKSGHRGVTWDRLQGRWVVVCYIDGIKTRYGSYPTVDEAVAVIEAEGLVTTRKRRSSKAA